MNKITEKQQTIINAAIKIIANHGIENLTIRKIAKEIGLTEGSIYNHFKDKNEIFLRIVDIFESNAQKLLEKIHSENVSSWEKLDMYFNYICEKVIREKDYMVVFFSSIIHGNPDFNNYFLKVISIHRNFCMEMAEKLFEEKLIRPDIPKSYLNYMIFGIFHVLLVRYIGSSDPKILNETREVWSNTKKLLQA